MEKSKLSKINIEDVEVISAAACNQQPIGTCSHAEGDLTVATGENSHAEGYGTTASGFAAHSEGVNTV
ncbi:hypothetical protein CN345_31145, partial [Bacillus thuringiensis]